MMAASPMFLAQSDKSNASNNPSPPTAPPPAANRYREPQKMQNKAKLRKFRQYRQSYSMPDTRLLTPAPWILRSEARGLFEKQSQT